MINSALVFLVYTSRINCNREEIDEIAHRSIQKNALFKMTGTLISDATHFLQFLEGPSAAAGDTILRIMTDRRHDDVRILICEPTQTRIFSDWHMKHTFMELPERAISEKMENFLCVPRAERGLLLQRFALELESSGFTAVGS